MFAIFTSQAWNMTFAFYQSLVSQPRDLDEASRLLRLSKWQRFWRVDVPGDAAHILIGVAVMSLYVVGLNRLFWRRLHAIAERRFSL